MSLIKILVLRLFPHLARIIKMRDEAVSENALLKQKIKELEKLVDGNSNIDKSITESQKSLKEGFEVTVFDRKTIPGKK